MKGNLWPTEVTMVDIYSELLERMKEFTGVTPESRVEGAQLESDLKPMELGAAPERRGTGIGAND